MRKLLDLPGSVILLFAAALPMACAGLIMACINRLIPRIQRDSKPTLLCLVPSGFEEIIEKGVGWMIEQRTAGGFFTRVHSVYYPSRAWGQVEWSPTQTVWKIPLLFRILRKWGFRMLFETGNGVGMFLLALAVSPWARRHVDIIRGQDPAIMGILASWLSVLTGIPACISIHADHGKRHALDPGSGSMTIWGRRRLASWIESIALRSTDRVWVIRKSLIAWVEERGVPKTRIRIFQHGIDPSRWVVSDTEQETFRKNQKLNKQHLLLFVGRVDPVNYVEDILEMIRRLYTQRRDILLVLVGDGKLRSPLETQCRQEGSDRFIRWEGFQPADQVRLWRSVSAVQLCLMGGFSLLEAAAAGRPIITYDVEWHSEVVSNNQTGILLPEHAIDLGVREIHQLLDEPDRRAALGTAARKRVQEAYAWPTIHKTHIEAYTELLQGK